MKPSVASFDCGIVTDIPPAADKPTSKRESLSVYRNFVVKVAALCCRTPDPVLSK